MRKQPTPNVLVASAAEASCGAEQVEADNVSGAVLENIDIEGIRTLHCVVMGYERDPGVLRSHKRAYVWSEVHGPWLDQFPPDLVDALADLPSKRFREISLRWWERL